MLKLPHIAVLCSRLTVDVEKHSGTLVLVSSATLKHLQQGIAPAICSAKLPSLHVSYEVSVSQPIQCSRSQSRVNG